MKITVTYDAENHTITKMVIENDTGITGTDLRKFRVPALAAQCKARGVHELVVLDHLDKEARLEAYRQSPEAKAFREMVEARRRRR